VTEDPDTALEEKRVHAERRERTRVAVASALGLATVDVSEDQIGRFALAHRLEATALAGDGRLAVATDEDVLVGDAEVLVETGFGPAVAVGVSDPAGDPTLLAAGPDGRIGHAQFLAPGSAVEAWTGLGRLAPPIAAIEGELVAAGDGVYRLADGALAPLGLPDVRDVAPGPLAATAEGVFDHDGDWHRELAGEATLVASDGTRRHAVVDGRLMERTDGTWAAADVPTAGVVAVADGPTTYAVTGEGTFLVDATAAKDGMAGWRTRELGLAGVVDLAVL